jgi:hypothetical protein
MSIGTVYLQSAIKRAVGYKELTEKAMLQLDDNDFFFRPNAESNNIAIIIQHLSGNMLSRWTNFLLEDGEKPWRSRDQEFEDQQLSKTQLTDLWEKGWNCFLGAIAGLNEDDLLKTIYTRSEPLSVVDAINRQLAHYPHHSGQIIYIAKMLRVDKWKSLSIEKGKSDAYNEALNHKATKDRQKH